MNRMLKERESTCWWRDINGHARVSHPPGHRVEAAQVLLAPPQRPLRVRRAPHRPWEGRRTAWVWSSPRQDLVKITSTQLDFFLKLRSEAR